MRRKKKGAFTLLACPPFAYVGYKTAARLDRNRQTGLNWVMGVMWSSIDS